MLSELDDKVFYLWVPTEAKLSGDSFELVVLEQEVSNKIDILEITPNVKVEFNPINTPEAPRRFIITIHGCVFLQILDECAYNMESPETREDHVIAEHFNSNLVEWVKTHTNVFDRTLLPIRHYSILTAENIYHVLSTDSPLVRPLTNPAQA